MNLVWRVFMPITITIRVEDKLAKLIDKIAQKIRRRKNNSVASSGEM